MASVSILGVLGLAILPPEHLHARRTNDGHERDVVHRHFEAHHQAGAGAQVAHNDAAPRWLDSPYVNAGSVTRVDRVDAAVEHEMPTARAMLAGARLPRLVTFAVHDPPPGAAFGLRAPPFSSL